MKDQIFKPKTIPEVPFPQLKIANEVTSPSFNSIKKNISGSFRFSESGALRISQKGYDGYVLLSPAGLEGYAGSTRTFYIDAQTGSAYFSGAISASTIDIGSGATSFHVDVNGNIWSGATAFASGVFKVSNAGVLTLTGASSSISIGSGNSIFIASSNGIQLGHATFASAPFHVTPAGALTATNAFISGDIELSNDGDQGTGTKLRWVGGTRIWSDSSNRLGINSIGSPMYIYVSSGEKVIIPASGQVTIRGGGFFGTDASVDSGHVNVWGTVRCGKIMLNQQSGEGNIEYVDIIKGTDDIRFQTGGSGQLFKFLASDGNEHAWINSSTGYIESDSDTIKLGGFTLKLTANRVW
jgi:hypothetical protein